MRAILFAYAISLFAKVNCLTCGEEEFSCKDGKRCISINYVCNDYANCLDDSDEEPTLCENWEYDYNFDNEDYDGKEFLQLFGLEEFGEQLGINSSEEKEPQPEKKKEDKVKQVIDQVEEHTLETFGEEGETSLFCSLAECDPRGILSFRTDHQYNYEYNLEIVTESLSRTKQQARVLIKSNVTLLGLSACELSLKITGVQSFNTQPNSGGSMVKQVHNKDFERNLLRNDLRFSMDGGVINYVCPKEDDVRVVNFKKGVISMLQNSMHALHIAHDVIEKDVTGECPTAYSYLDGKGASTLISKSKDLSKCKDRSYLHSSTNGVPYDFPGNILSLPIVNSTSNCQQEIRRGVIQSANCKERHNLTPFKSESTSILTSVNQNLFLTNEKVAILHFGKIFSRMDITYDHLGSIKYSNDPDVADSKTNNVEILESYLNSVKDEENTKKIGSVIRIFKKFSVRDFENVMIKVHRNIFFDALSFVNTEHSVAFMIKRMKSFKPNFHMKWIRSLSKIPSPNIYIVREVIKLLENKLLPPEKYLHIGAVINGHCRLYPGCMVETSIAKAMESFEAVIANKCHGNTAEDKIEIMMSLKGIGNAGIAVDNSLLESLEKCFQNEEIDAAIRATAIAAFRRIPCSASRIQLEYMFADQSVDAELRILAYIETMRCPNYRVINLVRNILSAEEVNQVGSFVWTHLKNLQETGMPSKLIVQSLLSDKVLEEKFKPDVRKFSRSIEWSAYYDEMNLGASLESNVVFSQKSYIPRIATVNLTADLFGKSFNFLEFGVRMEGFDKYIMDYFHPAKEENDNIRNDKITDLISRNKRGEQYLAEEADISLHMKTFGNDMFYQEFHGIQDIKKLSDYFNPIKLANGIKNGKKFSMQNSAMPISGVYYLATAAGFSLGINIDSIVSTDVSAQIEADITQLLISKSGIVRGVLEPALNIDVLASMTVDTLISKTGIEFAGKLHSSASINGEMEFDGYKLLTFDINLPSENIEVFDVSTRLMLVHETSDNSDDGGVDHSKELIGYDSMTDTTAQCTSFQQQVGVEFCYVWMFPHSEGPFSQAALLNGPMRIMASIRKKEEDLMSYKFRYMWEQTKKKTSFQLLLDTPDTAISREHRAELALDYVDHTVLLFIKSPKYTVNFKGKYIWKENEKRLDSTIRVNEHSGSAIIGYKIASKSLQSTLLPSVIVIWDKNEVVNIGGSLESISRVNPDKGDSVYYTVNLHYDIDISEKYTGKITGYVSVKQNEWQVMLEIPYSIENYSYSPTNENIHIEYTNIMKNTDSVNKYDRYWKVTFTQFPTLNTKGRLTSKKYYGLNENELQVGFGIGYERPKNQVTIYQNLIMLGESDHYTFNSTIAIRYPKKNLDLVMGLDFFRDRNDLNTGFLFQYAAGKAVSSRFHQLKISSDPLNLEVDVHLLIPAFVNFSSECTVKEVNQDSYQFNVIASFSDSAHIEVGGLYSDLSTNLNSLHNLELKINVPNRDTIYVNTTILQNDKEIAFLSQLILSDGYPYTLRVAYINEKDDFLVLERRLEVDFQLPEKLYYWHAKYSIGDFITISNVIHVDVYRDIIFWIQSPLDTEKSRSVEIKIYWDANRDPHLKATAKLVLTNQFFNYTGSLSILDNEYDAFWTASKLASHTDVQSNYAYNTEGFITWKDTSKQVHKLSSGLSFRLQRGAEAELIYKGFLITPFSGWEDNWFILEYTRNNQHIKAALMSQWHLDEFINMEAHSGKVVRDDGWQIESIVDINSSIEGLVTVKTQGSIERVPGKIITRGLIKWEADILEFMLEGENNSDPNNVRLSLSTKTTTTLSGFELMQANVDFMTAEGIVDIYGTVQWEDALYSLKTRGTVFTKDEFLRAEVRMANPEYGEDTAVIFLRLFKEPTDVHDKLEIIAKWYTQEINVIGELFSLPDDFDVRLAVATPFEILKQGSITLAHQRKDTYKTVAKAKWNELYSAGFLVDAYFNSLLDFLLNVELETPFSQFRIVKGEIQNLFLVTSAAQVRSRIFAQLNEKKFGIGGRLEQPSDRRLRVGLELYTPSPDLEEVIFDIAYNSTIIGKHFVLSMGHRKHQRINVAFQMQHTEQSLEVDLQSDVEVPILGEEYGKLGIDFGGKLFWMTSRDLRLNLLATTVSRTFKFTTQGSMFPGGGATITGELDFPYETLRDLDFSAEYKLSPYPSDGYATATLFRHSRRVFEFSVKGNVRDLAVIVVSPFPVIRDINVHYEMIAYDVKRSKFTAHGSLNGRELSIDSSVILNHDNYVEQIEGELKTSLYGSYKISTLVQEAGDQFVNVFQFANANRVYEMVTTWQYKSVQEWDFSVEIYENSTNRVDILSGNFLLHDVTSKPLKIAGGVKTPEGKYELELATMSQKLPYVSRFTWQFPGGAGLLRANMNKLSREIVSSETVLETTIPNEPRKRFTLSFDLVDHSPDANVNVDVDLGFSTVIGTDVNTITLNGTLRQITSNPGLIALKLKWPNSAPVELTASVAYDDTYGIDVRTMLDMQLPNCTYGYVAKITKEDETLLITSSIGWHKSASPKVYILFDGKFVIEPQHVTGNINMTLKYVRDIHWARLYYEKSTNETEIRGDIKFMERDIEIQVNYNEEDGLATMKSESFWEGNPITIGYKQTISPNRIIGIYSLKWPRYDNVLRTYEILLLEAKLNHSFLRVGHSGKIHLTLPVAKNNTLDLDYEFKFPIPDDVILKVHVLFGLLKFGIEGSDTLTKTDLFIARKTEVKLFNDIWPIAAAYIYHTYIGEEKIKEELSIYQLSDTQDMSQIMFTKKSDPDGKIFHIDANLASREVKYTTGYKYTDVIKSADVSLIWGEKQGLIGEFILQDVSQSTMEDRYHLIGRLGNMIQLVELNGEYLKNTSGIHSSFNYDWNSRDDDDDLIEGTFYLHNLNTKAGLHYSWNLEINHVTLEVPLSAEGIFERREELPISLKFLLHYSQSAAHDFHLDAYLASETEGRNMSNLIIISHPSSSLYAEMRGSVAVLYPKLHLDQLCVYTNAVNRSFSFGVTAEADVMAKNVYMAINTTSHRIRIHFDPSDEKGHIAGFDDYQKLSTWSTSIDSYSSLPVFIVTLENVNANTSADQSRTSVGGFNDLWLARKLIAEGGMEDQREVYLQVRHLQESNVDETFVELVPWTSDADIFLKLNHSRLLSSQIRWKKDNLLSLLGSSAIESEGIRQSIVSIVSHVVKSVLDESSVRVGPIVNELTETFAPFMAQLKNNSIIYRDSFVETFTSTKLTTKEQMYLEAMKHLYTSTMETILSLEIVQKIRLQMSGGTLNQQITLFLAKIADSMQYLLENKISTEDVRKSFNSILLKLAQYYDSTVKKLSKAVRTVVSDFQEKVQLWIQSKLHSVYNNYRPHILKTVYMIESGLFSILEQISKTTKSLREAFTSVSYLSYMQKVYTTFYEKYKEFSQRSLKENLEIFCDYLYAKFTTGMQSFIDKVFPFMEDWIANVRRAWKKLYNTFPRVRMVADVFVATYKRLMTFLHRLDLKDKLLTGAAFVINHGNRMLTQTSIDAELRNIKVKTHMEWKPEKGKIILQQKLPVDWKAFNQTPAWSKLFEIPLVTKLNNIYMAADYSLLDYWYKHLNINFSPWDMLPPFPAKAYFIGSNNVITFDGRHLHVEGNCEHLLAADLIYEQWAVSVKLGAPKPKTIIVYIHGKRVELFATYEVKIDNRQVGLPRELGTAKIWRTAGSIHLKHAIIDVTWNLAHDVVTVTVSGTSFLNTAGIFGTNNNEPMDDLTSPEGIVYNVADEQQFLTSWSLSSSKCVTDQVEETPKRSEICEDLFFSKMSPFHRCFHHVSPKSYYDVCLAEDVGNKKSVCAVSLAYRESCTERNIPLKLPTFCVECHYRNETTGAKSRLNEGEVVTMTTKRKSADIVLLAELSSCNRKRLQSAVFTRFITAFDAGLQDEGFHSSRYSVVAFGGSGIFQEANLVTLGPDMFVGAKDAAELMRHLKFGRSNSYGGSAFSAINFVSKLNFRPSTKIAILLFSCSVCTESDRLDYSTMYHIIDSSYINLVVFKEGFFDIAKQSIKKKIIGFDVKSAYTLKDSKRKKPGKNALQYQIKPPKKDLGYCYPLAIETGGSIFSSEFMKKSRKRSENLGKVVGRTLGRIPKDDSPQRCLCMSSNEATPVMRCDQWEHGDYTILEKYGLELDKHLVPDTYKQKDELERNFYIE